MALTIRGRLTLWYGLVVLVVLLSAGVAILFLHHQLGLADIDRELKNRAATVKAELLEEFEDGESLSESLEEIFDLELPGTGVAFVDGDDAVLALDGIGPEDPSPAEIARCRAALTLASSDGGVRLHPESLEWEGTRYRVVVWRSMAGFARERDVLYQAVLLGIPLAMLIAVVGGWSISRRALHPLPEMADQAAGISDKHPGARLQTPNASD